MLADVAALHLPCGARKVGSATLPAKTRYQSAEDRAPVNPGGRSALRRTAQDPVAAGPVGSKLGLGPGLLLCGPVVPVDQPAENGSVSDSLVVRVECGDVGIVGESGSGPRWGRRPL